MTYPRNTADDVTDTNDTVAAGELRQLIERVERLEEEARALNEDKSEVYAEARGRGYDVKVMKRLIQLRRKDPAQRQEEDAILELYMNALGMA